MWLRPSWRMCLVASNISRHSRPGNDGNHHGMLPRCRAAMCLPSLLEEMHVKAKLRGGRHVEMGKHFGASMSQQGPVEKEFH